MFSRRLYKIISIVLKLSNKFHVSFLKFDDQKLLLYCDRDPKLPKRMHANFALALCWCLGSLHQIICTHRQKDLNNSNFALAFLFGVLCLITLLTLPVFFGQEVCQSCNGHLTFFRLLHRKHLTFQRFLLKNKLTVLDFNLKTFHFFRNLHAKLQSKQKLH